MCCTQCVLKTVSTRRTD